MTDYLTLHCSKFRCLLAIDNLLEILEITTGTETTGQLLYKGLDLPLINLNKLLDPLTTDRIAHILIVRDESLQVKAWGVSHLGDIRSIAANDFLPLPTISSCRYFQLAYPDSGDLTLFKLDPERFKELTA